MVRARDRCADVYCDATTQQLAKHKVLHLYCTCAAPALPCIPTCMSFLLDFCSTEAVCIAACLSAQANLLCVCSL
jgi:hypothetical protein